MGTNTYLRLRGLDMFPTQIVCSTSCLLRLHASLSFSGPGRSESRYLAPAPRSGPVGLPLADSSSSIGGILWLTLWLHSKASSILSLALCNHLLPLPARPLFAPASVLGGRSGVLSLRLRAVAWCFNMGLLFLPTTRIVLEVPGTSLLTKNLALLVGFLSPSQLPALLRNLL